MSNSNSLFDLFGTDKRAEVEGVEFRFGDSTFIARRAGSSNKKYAAEMRRVFSPYRRQVMNDTIDAEVSDELMMKVYFRSVMIDWVNVTDKSGQVLPFNEKNFIWLMQELPDLWDALQENCAKLANFRADANDEDGTALGNS